MQNGFHSLSREQRRGKEHAAPGSIQVSELQSGTKRQHSRSPAEQCRDSGPASSFL